MNHKTTTQRIGALALLALAAAVLLAGAGGALAEEQSITIEVDDEIMVDETVEYQVLDGGNDVTENATLSVDDESVLDLDTENNSVTGLSQGSAMLSAEYETETADATIAVDDPFDGLTEIDNESIRIGMDDEIIIDAEFDGPAEIIAFVEFEEDVDLIDGETTISTDAGYVAQFAEISADSDDFEDADGSVWVSETQTPYNSSQLDDGVELDPDPFNATVSLWTSDMDEPAINQTQITHESAPGLIGGIVDDMDRRTLIGLGIVGFGVLVLIRREAL